MTFAGYARPVAIPDFVLRLRTKVGNDLLWIPAVSAVVLDDRDRLLLTHRVDNGEWGLPGGILDPGEQPASGIVREVREETGVDVEVLALTSAISGGVIEHANGDLAQYLVVTFRCRPVGGTAEAAHAADDENHDVRWFPLDALPGPLSDGGDERLAHALAHRDAERAGTAWAGPYAR